MNFTHFARLPGLIAGGKSKGKDGLADLNLAEFWIRQAAVLGVFNKHGWDIPLPVYQAAKAPLSGDRFEPASLPLGRG